MKMRKAGRGGDIDEEEPDMVEVREECFVHGQYFLLSSTRTSP